MTTKGTFVIWKAVNFHSLASDANMLDFWDITFRFRVLVRKTKDCHVNIIFFSTKRPTLKRIITDLFYNHLLWTCHRLICTTSVFIFSLPLYLWVSIHMIKSFKKRRPLFYTDSFMFIDKYYYGKLYIEHVMIWLLY